MKDNALKCVFCNAEISEGNNFCVKCGKTVKQIISTDINGENIICPKCYADVPQGNRFCTKCGAKLELITPTHIKQTSCPKCYAELQPGNRFCVECGTDVGTGSDNNICPKCYAENQPGLRYCTECGNSLKVEIKPTNENIKRELAKKRGNSRIPHSNEDPIDSIVGAGKDIMKGIGGFLDKSSSSLGSKIQNTAQKTDNNPRILKPRKVHDKPRYLVCENCDGYYELQPGESPNNFSDKCECGGKLILKHTIGGD